MGGLNSGPGPGITLLIAIVVVLTQTALAAPVHEDEETQESNSHALAESHGCYYNFQHYNEGERILTNEPCLNCTCRNRMLMCYLRVCPFTKGIGQNCTVEKVPGQCCPIITCPEVPVQLLTSTTTEHSEGGKGPSHYYGNKGTAVGHLDTNGCNIDGIFYPNGAQVPGSPEKPCELCYCIRNKTACIMQECALHVDGCRPVYEEGQCFPVRYQCDDSPYEEEPTTTIRPAPTPGLIITTTSSEPLECSYNNDIYEDGSRIPTEDPCEHCYCLKGKIACAVQECGAPLEKDGQNCTALPPAPGKCCPDSYQCDNNVIVHAKENFIRKDRKQKFEPKPVEHNDITMTSQGLSSGSEGTTQSGIASVADAGHPTDSYQPDKVTTEKPKLTTNRFDEESKVTEGVTPAKGIAEPTVTLEHQQELDKGTQKEKDSRPDQKITFPDELQPVKGEATISPTDHTDAHIIHMSPEKQSHPEIESHKQGVTPQIATNILSESSTPSVKDPLIDKLHNIIQDVQSQVGDGKTSQMPEEVDIQTTTQSQKGHFTEKPDVLSHLPHSSTPSTEITNTTKQSSPEDTNILNQIQGIIQGIYSHVTDSIMSTKQPESTTEVGQLPEQPPSISEKEGVAGSYPGKHPEGNRHPEYPHGVTERPERPIGTDYSESVTDHSDVQKPLSSTKHPQKLGSQEESYGTQYPGDIGATGRPEGPTKHSEIPYGTQYPELGEKPKDPNLYPARPYPNDVRPDDSKYPEAITGKPEDSTKYPGGVGVEYPHGVNGKPKDPNEYPEGVRPDTSKYPEAVSGKPQHPSKYPGQRPGVFKPTGEYPDSSKYPEGVPGKPEDSTEYPYTLGTEYPENLSGKPQHPSKYPSQRPGVFKPTGEYPDGSKHPEGVPGKPEDSTAYPYGHGTEYPEGIIGKPKDPSKYPEGTRPSPSKYPEGISERPEDHTKYPGQHPGEFKPTGQYSEGVTGKPEDFTDYPYGLGTGHPEGMSGKPKDPSEYPEGVKPSDRYPDSSKYPERVSEKPKDPSKYPEGVRPDASKYPEGVSGRPEDQTKYPGQRPGIFKPTEKYPVNFQYPEGVTGKPEDSTEYPYGVGTEFPQSVSGKPQDPSKYPHQRPGVLKPTGEYPDGSKYPEGVTGKPEDSTQYPYGVGMEYPESVSGKPKDPSKYPEGVRPSDRYPDPSKYPDGVSGTPEDHTKYPGQRPGVFKPTGEYPDGSKYPEGVTGKPEDSTDYPYGLGTEYPEGVSGKPKDPSKYPEGVRPSDRYPDPSKYPEGVSGRPEDHTKYPGQRPGVFKPTGEHPDDSKYPEGVTGKPDESTKYPYGVGTEFPEGVSGKPKDPSKYPEGVRPGASKYPEGVSGRPEDHTKYPGQRPDVLKPIGEYPEGVTGKPEYSTEYPYGHGTEYPEGVSGKPKDPSKYPEGVKPSDRYPDSSKYPEGVSGKPKDPSKYPEGVRPGASKYPDGVSGTPEDHTKYPGQRPGVFKPTGEYPDGSKYPEGVTAKPEDSTEYPFGVGTEFPEGLSGKPKDPTKYPEGVRPGASKYPEGVSGRPEDHTKYPGQRPGVFKPTGEYSEGVTGKPEDSTEYPYDHGTEYPEGVSGKPKDPSKYSEGVYPDATKYPGGVGGRPEDHTKYPGQRPGVFKPTETYPDGSKHPEGVTGKPEYSTEYPYGLGTEHPEGVSGKPKDPSKYPEGVRPSDRYPEVSKYPEYPEVVVTGRPEDTTYYTDVEDAYGTHYPAVNARPKDPSKFPGMRPSVVTGLPGEDMKHPDAVPGFRPTEKYPHKTESETKLPDFGVNEKPQEEYPEKVNPTGQYPIGSNYPDRISARPSGSTEQPEGFRPTGHYKEGVTGTPNDLTKYPFDSKHPLKPGDNIYGAEYPDTTGKPDSGHEGTGKLPSGSAYGTSPQPVPVGFGKPQESNFGDSLSSTEYPEKVTSQSEIEYPYEVDGKPHTSGKYPENISTEYPKGAKPSKPYTRPGAQDEPFGTEYPETTDSEYETKDPESGTKYPMLSNYPTRRPAAGDKHQQEPVAEDETNTEHVEGSTAHPELVSNLTEIKRPVLKPEDTPESVTDISEGLKPSGSGHHPSGPGSTVYPNKKPEDDSHGTEDPGADHKTERPHYTSKYPQKPSAEDQLLVTEQPDSKVTSLVGANYPSQGENKVPTGDIKQPSEDFTKTPDHTSKRPARPDHPEDFEISTKDIPHGTEYPGGSVTDKYPEEPKRPSRPKPIAEKESIHSSSEDVKIKHPESVTGRPEDQPNGTESPGSDQTKYPQAGMTEYTKGKPLHPTKYPEESEPSVDKTGAQNPEDSTDHFPHKTNKPSDQYPGTQYPEGVTGQPEYPQGTKQPEQSPTKTTNTTKESSPDESTNILNQIHGIIQGIYSQVTDSIMSTIRPESTTVISQEESKPQEDNHYPHSGQTGMKEPSGTQFPDGVKYPEVPQGVTGRPQIPSMYPETDKYPENVAGHPDRFGPTGTPGVSTKYPQHIGSDKENYPTQSPDQTGQTGSPEGSTGYTDGNGPYGTEYPHASGRPKEPTKSPQFQNKYPGSQHSSDPKHPIKLEDTSQATEHSEEKPEYSTKYPEKDYATEYPGVSSTPKDSNKYPEGQIPEKYKPDPQTHDTKPHSQVDSVHPSPVSDKPGVRPESYPEGITEQPESSTTYLEVDEKYPGISGSTMDPIKYPETVSPYHPRPTGSPHGTEHPDATGQPDGTDDFETNSKYPQKQKPETSEDYGTDDPESLTHRPGHYPVSKRPGSRPKPSPEFSGNFNEPQGGKPTFQDEGITTEYPEVATDKHVYNQYPNQSGYPKRPVKIPQSPEHPNRGSPNEQYPGVVTGTPGDHTQYPEQRPGVINPTEEYPNTSKYPEGVTGKPEDSTDYPYGLGTGHPEGISGKPKDPSKYPEGVRPDASKYPEGVSGRPEDQTKYPGQRPGIFKPTEKYPDNFQYPEGVTGKPEDSTEYPYGVGTEFPQSVSGKPQDPSKYPHQRPGVLKPTGEYPDGSKYPEGVTGKPEDSTQYPYGVGTEYPESVSGKPKDPSKYPEGVRPSDRYPDPSKYPEGVSGKPEDHTKYPGQRPGVFKPTGEYPDGSKYPEGITGKPEDSTKYPYGVGTEYPEGVSGKPKDPSKYPEGVRPGASKYPDGVSGTPEDHTKYPGQRPGVFKPTGEYPDGSKYPEGVTGKPEDSTDYPYGLGTEYPESVSGKPKDPSKYPEGVRPSDRYPDPSKYPEGVNGRPEDYTNYPGQRPGVFKPTGEHPDDSKYPEGVTGKPDESTKYPYGVSTEYPESVSGKPKDPSKYPEGVRPGASKYPEGVSGRPEDHTKYPGQRPGVLKPIGEYPEGVTGKPEYSTEYPYGHGTEYTEGVSGKPKDPSKYPEGVKPSDRYPDPSKYPEEVNRRPEDHTKYPGERPGTFKPTGEYPEGSKYPEGVTGKPEDSTEYPYGLVTEYPESVSGKPKDPSKYPEGVRPSDRYPYPSKYPEGVSGRPEDHTKYPGQRPGVLKPIGEHPDDSKYPEGITGTPEESTKYPYGHGTEYPEAVSGKPKEPSKYPEGVYPEVSKYPEGVGGRPEDHSKHPGERPGVFKPTGEYPDSSKYPEGVTEKPEDSTEYPYGLVTEYPEGVSGKPKDPSQYPEGVKPSDRYPDSSKYPEGVSGRPEDHTKYPGQRPGVLKPTGEHPDGSKYPERVTGKPDESTKYPDGVGTEFPEGVSGKPKDPTKYPEGVRPGASEYPEGAGGRPEGHTKYPGQRPDVLKPIGEYPEGVTGKPEYSTEYPYGHGTEFPEGVSGKPKDPTKYPEGVRPGASEYPEGAGGSPDDHTEYPGQRPGVLKPTGEHPDGSKYPEGVTGKPEYSTEYPYGHGTEYPEGVSGRPKDPNEYAEGIKPSDRYPDSSKYPEGVSGRPEDHTKYPGLRPSVFKPTGEHPDGSKHPEGVTGKPEDSTEYPYGLVTEYPEGVSGKPKDPSKYPEGVRPSDRYPEISKYPEYPEGVTGRPEGSTYYPEVEEAFGTEYFGTNGRPKDPSNYPGVRPPGVTGRPGDGTKHPETHYPQGVKPEDLKPSKQPITKYPENVTSRPEDQTKYPEIITGRPEGPTHYPEGDSHVTEHPSVSGRPKDPSKKPEGIESGQYPAELIPSEQHPGGITGKPEEHIKHPDEMRPGGSYPSGSEYPQPSGVTGKPSEVSDPKVKPTEQFEGDSKRPDEVKPSEQAPEEHLGGYKPTANYPHELTVKPEDQSEYPEGIKPTQHYPANSKYPEKVKPSQKYPEDQPESTTYYPEENYGSEYPGMSGRPKDPSTYPEGFKPDDKYSQKPDNEPGFEYPQSVTGQYPGTTSRPHYSTKYPGEGKPLDKEGITDRPVYQTDYPEGAKPTEEYPEGFKPTGKYPVDSEYSAGHTNKTNEGSKYPDFKPSQESEDESKIPENIKPSVQHPDGTKYPGGVTGRPQDYTQHPEGSTTHESSSSNYPQGVTEKPEDKTKYPEGVTEHYPVGSKYPEETKPTGQHPEPSEVTGKPHGISKYPEEKDPEDSKHPGTKYPEFSKPSPEYPYEQRPSEEYPDSITGRPESVTDYSEGDFYTTEHPEARPEEPAKYPEKVKPGQHFEGFEPSGQYPDETKRPFEVTGKPEDATKYPEHQTKYNTTGITSRPDDHTKYPESVKPGQRPHQPENEYPQAGGTGRPEHQTEYPEKFTDQYPEGVTDKNTKYPGETVRPEYITKYPGVRPGGHESEGSVHPTKPESTSDSTEYPEVTGKYPEETTGKLTKRPGFKPSAGLDLTTIGSMDLEHTSESEVGVPDLIEYPKKPKPEQPSDADAATTVWPIHKYPQRPDGLGDESSGTEYPETTESDFEYATERPDVTDKYPDDSKPGVSRPKPDTEYLPEGSEKPSFQTHGLDEDSLPSKETQTDRIPITDSEQGKPIHGLKPSLVDDYPSRPRPTIPGEGLYNEDLTQKPSEQSTSGTGVHPTVELTPDIKIPEGDLLAGQPEKYPSTEKPLESLSTKPVDGSIKQQLGTNRHPETTSDDDLINKLHNIISGIQSQTNIPVDQSTFSPQGVDKIVTPASTRVTESHATTKGSYVTDRPQEGSGFTSVEEVTQHSDSSKPLSTEDPKVSEKYPEPTGSDKTGPYLPTESTFHTVTPQDEVQKQTSTDKPLHVVYPTYYPDGIVTRKPGAKPDDGDKKVTVTPQSTHEKAPEQGEIHTVYDVQTEISSETATTPGVVIVEEVHTEVHSERPTKRPIFGPAITQPGSSDLTTHSGYQTEVPETTKPSYVTVTPIGTISESDHIMHLYSPKEKHPASDTPTTQSFITEPSVQQHTRFPSRKTTQTPIDELTTHKPQGASYVPYKLVNSTKVYYPEKELSQKPFEYGPYDGYDHLPYEVVNGTKFFYPNRVATEQPTTSATLGMYVPYKVINGTKVYYTQDPPQEPEKYDGLDYVPFEIINGTKVFYPEKISTTPSPTTAMYVPFKIANGNKVYYPKDAKDEPQDVPDEYDGFDYVPFETVNGKKVFHPERIPNHTPAGSDYVPYKLMNNTKIYYPKDAQTEQENIPKGYDGFDSVPYDIVENEKVYYPEKASPQKPSAMFVPYKLVNGTKVYYPKHGQDKPTQPPEGYDGFDYIPYDTVNGTKVFHPERITPKPAYYPNKMFVPYKIVNNTKVFYPKDAQSKPRPLKPEYDGVEYLPYDVVNGTKVFRPLTAPTSAMYVPYVVKNGEKVYDLKKATDDPKGVPEGYDGVDYLPYEVKDGSMVFYPEKIAAPKPKEGAMYVPYKLINGTKIYYADKATDKPEDVPEEYDGLDYLPYELQNGNKIFYPDRVTTATTLRPALYVPYKLINRKKIYDTEKASENPQDIPEEFDGFDYVPYDIKNGNKIFYPEQVIPVSKEGAMYVPYKLINGTKVHFADKATDKPEDLPKDYDGFDYIPYKLENGNKIFYPDKIATTTTTTPITPKPALYVPYKLIDGKKVYQTDKATENPQDIPEEFDGFDYVPYDDKNGNKVFYPERVKPTQKEGAMYVPYKLNNGTKVYYADKATDKPEDVPKEYDGFDYIPYELQNGNKLFYPDRLATPTTKKAMYVPYKLDNGKKVYQTDKATDNPLGIPGKFDGFDYVPYNIINGNKIFYPEKVIPAKGSEYVPYKIVKGMKVYHPEMAADKSQEIPEEFDGFDYLPFETQNGNKIFYPDRVTPPPKGAIYVPYKLVNGKKVYNPNKATNDPHDIPKGFDGCDYIPYEIKNGNKVFYPEQVTTPAPTQGFMYVPYKLINGTKVYYADKATDKQEDLPAEFDGLDYLPYELQNGNKIFYPDKATTPSPNKSFKYIPYKLINGRKVYYPDRAADTPEGIPKGYDGFDYLPVEYITKPQDSQGMFVPYKTINGTKVYYPQEAHKRPHPLSDEYSGLDYMPYETVNGTKVFYPEREPQAMYVPYKIINGSKVFYPKDAQRDPEKIPADYDGLDYVPYDVVNGTQIFHPDRVPEYQGMFVPYKIVNGKKVFYPKYAQHKPMVMDGYDGFDYLPYENVNGTKVFKPEIPEQAMYVPYKIINGTKVYYPKFAQRKPEVPVGYDGSDYIPYQLVNGTKIFDPSIKPAMYVPYKIMDGTKVYYPKHAQHKPEHIPSGYDGHDYLPYEVINGNKVFKPEQATPQEQVTPQIKQAMYVPYKIVNGTKVYYPKHAQNKPEYIPDGYDGHDYLPYEIVNGNKVFKPEQVTPQIKQAMYVPYKVVNGTKVYYPKHAQHTPYLIPSGYDGFDYIPYEVVNGNKVFHPEQATTAPPSPKQAMYVPYKLINGTKAYYPKHAQHTPTPVPFNYDGLDYLPYEIVNGTKIFEPQPYTKPTYLLGMFVPYKLSNNTKIFYPKDAHNKPHYVPEGYDGADYVPYEPVNNTKLFYPELISMAQPSTANIPGIYVPFRLVNNKKVFYPKEATPFPPTVRYPYDGVAFVPYKSSVPSEIVYVDEDDLTKPYTLSGHVPGEGNCYLNNRTYANNTEIAPVSPCQARCTCISSVVRCVRVKCPSPPQNKLDCSPVYREGTCCPTYTCGESENEYSTTVGYPEIKAPEGTSHGHDSESTTAFTDLTSQKKPGFAEEGKPGQQSEEYHLHKPPKPSEHESLEPYDNVEGQLSPEEDYDVEDEEPYGPGTCRYAGKVYVSAQQIPRDDPCDFCFCFRSDIICLQQSCPPPIPGCRDEPIEGFCCPRYECHVKMATLLNVTSTTTTTTTTLPPHFFPNAYKGSATRTGCFVQGKAYRVGQPIPSASGPCMDCICGGNGRMKCEPKVCTPEPMIRKMMSPSESTTTSTNKR